MAVCVIHRGETSCVVVRSLPVLPRCPHTRFQRFPHARSTSVLALAPYHSNLTHTRSGPYPICNDEPLCALMTFTSLAGSAPFQPLPNLRTHTIPQSSFSRLLLPCFLNVFDLHPTSRSFLPHYPYYLPLRFMGEFYLLHLRNHIIFSSTCTCRIFIIMIIRSDFFFSSDSFPHVPSLYTFWTTAPALHRHGKREPQVGLASCLPHYIQSVRMHLSAGTPLATPQLFVHVSTPPSVPLQPPNASTRNLGQCRCRERERAALS